MELDELSRNWDQFGKDDPLWAILTEPSKRGGKWDLDDFFETGRREVAFTLERVDAALADVNAKLRRGRALDFGCGVGRLTQALAEIFDECDGIDIAPSMIEQARRYNRAGERCRFHANDRSDLSLFDDCTFDFIFTAHVLQHMRPDFARRYVAEFMRVLQPGGVVMFELATVSRHRTEALPDEACRAAIRLVRPPRKLRPGATRAVKVRVRNDSSITWPRDGDGPHALYVGDHWSQDGQWVEVDDGRARLVRDVPPGDTIEVELPVRAPAAPGEYVLEVDLVEEAIGWFAERGSQMTTTAVKVKGRPAGKPAEAASATGRAADTGGETTADTDADAVMEMYGTPIEEVRGWVEEAGGVIGLIDWDDLSGVPARDWERVGFIVRKSPAP